MPPKAITVLAPSAVMVRLAMPVTPTSWKFSLSRATLEVGHGVMAPGRHRKQTRRSRCRRSGRRCRPGRSADRCHRRRGSCRLHALPKIVSLPPPPSMAIVPTTLPTSVAPLKSSMLLFQSPRMRTVPVAAEASILSTPPAGPNAVMPMSTLAPTARIVSAPAPPETAVVAFEAGTLVAGDLEDVVAGAAGQHVVAGTATNDVVADACR